MYQRHLHTMSALLSQQHYCRYPDVWGNSLVESPSLWIDEGRWYKEVVTAHR
jgi:predicted alpha/beta superfamily hydrolase